MSQLNENIEIASKAVEEAMQKSNGKQPSPTSTEVETPTVKQLEELSVSN